MSGEAKPTPRVRVSDKRIRANESEAAKGNAASDVAPEASAEPEVIEPERNYLEDLMRLQAEFDNYRKRMMREQTDLASRANSRLIERLLAVLDNFDRALEHDSDNSGLQLIHKELVAALDAEGLAAIDVLGEPFDPNLHEAVHSHQDDEVSEPTCTQVYRTGYMLKGKVLRPAMVVVSRPPEAVLDQSIHEGEGE